MRITEQTLKFIETRGRLTYPAEVCGLLAGRPGGREILEALPGPNLAQQNDEFLIDPAWHIKTRRDLRNKGLDVIGVFHSHPGGDSNPSGRDKKGLSNPGFLWLITAISEGVAPKSSLFREIGSESPQNLRAFVEVPLQIEKIPA